jgi:hypothetical protein
VLGCRQFIDPRKDRTQQQVQTREGEVSLALQSGRGKHQHSPIRRLAACCGEERGLADACLSRDDERSTVVLRVVDEAVDDAGLAFAPDQIRGHGGRIVSRLSRLVQPTSVRR